MRFERCKMLMGDNFKKLCKAKILLLGVGGVGSFCLDCLVRSGVEDITIVDFDKYDITNQNRQIGSDKVGAVKVYRLAELYPTVTPIEAKIDNDWIDNFDFSSFNLVLDAIDDIHAKVALAHKVSPKLISATGGARKMDPTKIEVSSIWKTYGDPFARKIRYELRKSGFKVTLWQFLVQKSQNAKQKGVLLE